MVGPQLENGYTRIANELLEAIAAARLSKNQVAVLLAVIRKTYGFQKKQDDLTITQLARMTTLHRSHTSRAFHELVQRNVLIAEISGARYRVGINKDFTTWGAVPKPRHRTKIGHALPNETGTESVPKTGSSRTNTATHRVPKPLHTKENSKETSQKKKETSAGDKRPAGNGGGYEPVTAATWTAYSSAYKRRYGVEPVRNASVNGKLAQFVNRVGRDDAPHIATYFVGLNVRWYVTKGHVVGVMLQDAEKLATEWRTNRSVTDTEARRVDRTESNRGVFQRLLDEEQAKHGT